MGLRTKPLISSAEHAILTGYRVAATNLGLLGPVSYVSNFTAWTLCSQFNRIPLTLK